jgi:hypothetical protein
MPAAAFIAGYSCGVQMRGSEVRPTLQYARALSNVPDIAKRLGEF